MEKQIITFSASEQTLTKTGGIDHYASNTASYVQAIFDLGENWAGFDSVRAVFKTPYKTKPAVLDHSGRCLVPFEVLKYKCKVLVNLVGSISEEGVLTDRLTSYPIEALTIDANASVDNSETAISPTEFEEFVAIVSDDADRAEAGATASEASADSAEASAESALASAQASEASAIRASNSASDASASAQTAQEEAQKITGMVVVVTQLPEGATPTSDWSDGVLTIGIPKGDTGETGATGNGIESAVLNANYTLTLTFTDGTSYTTPSIRGATGATGATGNGISSVTLTSTSGAVKTYTIAFTDGTNTTFDVTDGEVTQAVLDETVSDLKSEITDNGVVQGSQGLVSDSKISDSVPYLYRQTADGQRVGNVCYEEIVGGTVAFNQIAYLRQTEYTPSSIGVTYTPISESSFRLHGTISAVNDIYLDYHSDAIQHIAGHKYIAWVSGPASASSYFKFHQGTKYYPNILNSPYMYAYTSGSINNDIETLQTGDVDFTFHWNRIDLTQMFGTTIADHLYQLETATAGAGVAVFRKMFPSSYYPYNAGELKSVEGVSAHVTTGKNLFDDRHLTYGLPATAVGSDISSITPSTRYAYFGFVPPKTTMVKSARSDNSALFSTVLFFGYKDGKLKYYGAWGITAQVTVDGNTYDYVRLAIGATSGNVVPQSLKNVGFVQLEIGSTATAYEPYVKRTYALDSTLTLRGIPKLSDGKIYYDGDVYKSDGSVTRRYGTMVLNGSNEDGWSAQNDTYVTYISNSGIKRFTSASATNICIISDRYPSDGIKYRSDQNDKTIMKVVGDSTQIAIKDSSFADASAFSAYIAQHPITIIYELATPTEESAEPYTSPQIVDKYGTEEYVTTGIVPVGHNSKYSEDLKGKVESLPWDFSTLIAPTETAYKATRNYTSGSLLIVNNTLYKATANIQSGGTITPNTNVTATTLSEVIANL